MYIENIKLENFKSFKKLDISCNENFNLIVGENNIGKSSIFEALLLWQFAYKSLIQSKNKKKFFNSKTNTYINFNDLSLLRIVDDSDLFYVKTKKRLSITVTIRDDEERFSLKISLEKPGIKNSYFRLINNADFSEFERFSEHIEGKHCSLRDAVFIYQTKPVSVISRNEPFYNNAQVQRKIAIGKSHDVLRNKVLRTEDANSKVAEKFNWLESRLERVLGNKFQIRFKNSNRNDDEFIRITAEINQGKELEVSMMGSGFLQVLEIFSTLGYFDLNYDGLRLVLIDEPDSHIHSDLQHRLFDELKSLNQEKDFQLFVISHNDRLVNKANADELYFLNSLIKESGTLQALPIENYSEVKESLSKVMTELEYQNEQPIVITEGKTDQQLINLAWSKLFPGEIMPFVLVSSGTEIDEEKRNGGARAVQQTITYVSNITDSKIIGLFDNDQEGYNQFCSIKEDQFELVNESEIKKHRVKNVYAMCLPVLEERALFSENGASKENRYFVIEHYFSDEVLERFEMKGPNILGTEVFKIKGKKTRFVQNCADLESHDFFGFNTLFVQLKALLNE